MTAVDVEQLLMMITVSSAAILFALGFIAGVLR